MAEYKGPEPSATPAPLPSDAAAISVATPNPALKEKSEDVYQQRWSLCNAQMDSICELFSELIKGADFREKLVSKVVGKKPPTANVGSKMCSLYNGAYGREVETPMKIAAQVFKTISPLIQASYNNGELQQFPRSRGVTTNRLESFRVLFDFESPLQGVKVLSLHVPTLKRLVRDRFGLDINLAAGATETHPIFDLSWSSPELVDAWVDALLEKTTA